MRFMGDSYIKSEFRLTRSADNPIHIIGFLSQWKMYLQELEASTAQSLGKETSWRGLKLDMEKFEQLNTEQVGQLYELMHATRDMWKR